MPPGSFAAEAEEAAVPAADRAVDGGAEREAAVAGDVDEVAGADQADARAVAGEADALEAEPRVRRRHRRAALARGELGGGGPRRGEGDDRRDDEHERERSAARTGRRRRRRCGDGRERGSCVRVARFHAARGLASSQSTAAWASARTPSGEPALVDVEERRVVRRRRLRSLARRRDADEEEQARHDVLVEREIFRAGDLGDQRRPAPCRRRARAWAASPR